MKKSKQLIGLDIIEIDHVKVVGKITGTVYFPDKKKILGFSVDCGKWIKKQMILPVKDIVNIGKDAAMIKKDDVLKNVEDFPSYKEALDQKNRVVGLPVISSDGDELGYIEDIIIDEKTYSIEGYVLTDGIVEDILKGKSVLPFEDEIIFGEDAVIVNNRCKNIILKNDILLKRVFVRGRRLKD